MEFSKLEIRRNQYRDNRIEGSVEFGSELGKVQMVLDERMAQEILTICAAALTRTTARVAEEMTASVFEGDALPAPEDGS